MLLTLDLATHMGWTLGKVEQVRFSFGTHHLPSTGEDIGSFALAYDTWLCEAIKKYKVNEIVMECPILPRETSLTTVRKLSGLAWHTEYVCACHKIKNHEAHLQQIKKFMTGSGRADKQMMIDAARRHGYRVSDDNQADAVGVRLFYIACEYPALSSKFDLAMGALGAAAANAHDNTDTDQVDF